MQRHLMTVDVEDNFILEELADEEDWPRYEGQVVENILRILSLLRRYKTKATFFAAGMVVERRPELIDHIMRDGHEIASHSYWHTSLRLMSVDELEADIKKSTEILTSMTGQKILGFRAMGYSIPEDEAGFYALLKKYGYKYDSSKRRRTDGKNSQTIEKGDIARVFPSSVNILGIKTIFSGGTYLRWLPEFVINQGFSQHIRARQPVMLYVHPWEFNKDQPKRTVRFKYQILQSPLTFSTERKLNNLLKKHKFVSISEYMEI